MIILHCIRKQYWDTVKDETFFGKEMIEQDGFIHCSTVEYFWRVAPNFKNVDEDIVLLCIDTDALKAEIKWEDGDDCGRYYPHIYGLINTDSIVDILPYIKDLNGNFIKNKELMNFPDK